MLALIWRFCHLDKSRVSVINSKQTKSTCHFLPSVVAFCVPCANLKLSRRGRGAKFLVSVVVLYNEVRAASLQPFTSLYKITTLTRNFTPRPHRPSDSFKFAQETQKETTEGNSDRHTSFVLNLLLKPVIYRNGKKRHINAKNVDSRPPPSLGCLWLDFVVFPATPAWLRVTGELHRNRVMTSSCRATFLLREVRNRYTFFNNRSNTQAPLPVQAPFSNFNVAMQFFQSGACEFPVKLHRV